LQTSRADVARFPNTGRIRGPDVILRTLRSISVNVTDARVRLATEEERRDGHLLAYVSIVLDDALVLKDLRLIEGARGPFVAFPSKKLCDRCPGCGNRNHLRGRFCSRCGVPLAADRARKDADGKSRLFVDVAHPICARTRETIEAAVFHAYGREVELAAMPGYVCRYVRPEDARATAMPAPLAGRARRGVAS
jgi:stage V sporulation protein G